jgi:hypothetical protein
MQTRRETQASISVSSRPEPIRAHHRPPCPLCPPGLLVLLFSTFLLAASNATARAGNLVLNYQISQ